MQRGEGDGGILLGDNTGDGALMLWPIRFECIGLCISTGLYPRMYTGLSAGHTHSNQTFNRPSRTLSVAKCCVRRGVSVPACNCRKSYPCSLTDSTVIAPTEFGGHMIRPCHINRISAFG